VLVFLVPEPRGGVALLVKVNDQHALTPLL